MAIRAVVFDIGGVLEITPALGSDARWEAALGLERGTIHRRAEHLWRAGSIGAISEADVHRGLAEALSFTAEQVEAYMADLWREYLGTLNAELAQYFAGLRPRFKTGILSNSFVGAREKERAAYDFESMCDDIVYSHEVGMQKPDPRIYLLACERLGVEPGETIFLDNVEEAVNAARALGIHGVLFTSNAQAIADIEACIVREGSGDGSERG